MPCHQNSSVTLIEINKVNKGRKNYVLILRRASQEAQWVKNLPAMQKMQEMQVQSLGWEDPPDQGMATHSSILAWTIPWTEEPDGLQSIGLQKAEHD